MSASPSLMFARTHQFITALWVLVKLKIEDRVEDHLIHREDQEIKAFLLSVARSLAAPGDRAERECGEDGSSHMSCNFAHQGVREQDRN